MSDRYQAYRVNRVWIVMDEILKQQVGGPFVSEQEADCAILELWRNDKPQSSLSEPLRFESGAELEEAIVGIVDRIHGPAELWARAA